MGEVEEVCGDIRGEVAHEICFLREFFFGVTPVLAAFSFGQMGTSNQIESNRYR
jgi:hypothetical protein